MNDKRGFTLLELLMVVIIIGILASIALPQYFKTAERARSAEAKAMLATIRGSQMRFKAQSPTNLYSISNAALDVGIATSAIWTAYTAPATGDPGVNETATRAAATGPCSAGVLEIDLDSGAFCTSTAGCGDVWGVTQGAC